MIKKYFSVFVAVLLYCSCINAQTIISGGNVSGTWTKANSPYKVNDIITIPNGSTLTIEPGVKIEFAQFKYMKVNGRITAIGGASSTDSIWFTKQNTHDTGSWKGVKFIRTDTANDTSVFKYCVFRNCKSIYDTLLANRSGGITVLKYGKVKVANCTFYKNESNTGASIFLTNDAFIVIKSCTFKNNIACQFWWFENGSYYSYKVKGSAIAVEGGSKGVVDSCLFKNNKRGKDYKDPSSILYDASVVDIEGSTYDKKSSYITIQNSVFDGNEGVSVYAYDKAYANIYNTTFINSPAIKSYKIIYAMYNSVLKTQQCIFKNNKCANIVEISEGSLLESEKDIVESNSNFDAIYLSNNASGLDGTINLNRCKIFNNKYDSLYNYYNGGIVANSISNCLIANNNVGRLLYGTVLTNNTIVNNYAKWYIISTIEQYSMYTNNIIWGNKSDSAKGKQIHIPKYKRIDFESNIVQYDTAIFWPVGLYSSIGKPVYFKNNIDLNPQFVNPTVGYWSIYNAGQADFSLKNTCLSFSPGINNGKFINFFDTSKSDLAGNKRIKDEFIDIGCYESIQESSIIKIKSNLVNDTLCEKSRSAKFNVLAIGKGLAYQWQSSVNGGSTWGDINGAMASQLQISNTTPSQNAILYRAVLTGSCDKDTSAIASVITHATPLINLGNDTGVCKNSVVKKSITIGGTYLWHNGANANSVSQRIVKDSLWWLQVTNAQGCKSRDSLFITAHALPIVNLGPDKSIDKLESLTLNAGSGQSSYLWNDGSDQSSKTFLGKDLGPPRNYTLWVEVVNNKGCSARDSIKITVTDNLGINSVSTSRIKLYPQPASNELNVVIPQEYVNEHLGVKIYATDGKLCYEATLEQSLHSIPIQMLSNGLYIITIVHPKTGQIISLTWIKG
ncbi:MAG: right-handed parallel beta-helix repeat-containing protein [Bacteroidota bacterium]